MKKSFRRLIGLIVLQCGLFLFFVHNSFAAGSAFFDSSGGDQANTIKAVTTASFGTAVVTVINYFLGILGLIAVGFLIYAGVLMVTAGGVEEQITKSKKIITYAVIGIIIILLAFTIVTFVSSALG